MVSNVHVGPLSLVVLVFCCSRGGKGSVQTVVVWRLMLLLLLLLLGTSSDVSVFEHWLK